MLIHLFIILAALLPPPELEMNWFSKEAVKVILRGTDEWTQGCLSSGLEVRYRFEFRLCQRRLMWWDSCGKTVTIIHALQYEPISERYRVNADRLGDLEGPLARTFASNEEALAALASVDNLSLASLDSSKKIDAEGIYLGARVLTSCRSEYSQTMERISSVITLGMVRTGGFDSGWVDFRR